MLQISDTGYKLFCAPFGLEYLISPFADEVWIPFFYTIYCLFLTGPVRLSHILLTEVHPIWLRKSNSLKPSFVMPTSP